MMQLKSLVKNDLNLLVTLYVLLQEKSVSRTADRLFVTQPAISKSLGRLREVFDDPLFTRTSRGLIPTPLADSLMPRLEKLLIDASEVFIPDSFDAQSYQGVINIAVTESLDMMFFPRVIAKLHQEAPGLVIKTRSHVDNQLVALEEGKLDFAINLQYADLSDGFLSEQLLSDPPVILARTGHPLQGKVIDDSHIGNYPRISLHLPDFRRFSFFSRHGGPKRLEEKWPIAFETENLVTALSTIAQTDYLLPAPKMLFLFSGEHLPLCVLHQSLIKDTQFIYCMVSHQRTAGSAIHQWVRQLILEEAAKFESEINAINTEGGGGLSLGI